MWRLSRWCRRSKVADLEQRNRDLERNNNQLRVKNAELLVEQERWRIWDRNQAAFQDILKEMDREGLALSTFEWEHPPPVVESAALSSLFETNAPGATPEHVLTVRCYRPNSQEQRFLREHMANERAARAYQEGAL